MSASADHGATPSFLLVVDEIEKAPGLAGTLSAAGFVETLALDRPQAAPRHAASNIVVDIDLRRYESISWIREIFRKPKLEKLPRTFLINSNDYQGDRQARALGATRLIERPLQAHRFLNALRAEMASTFKADLDTISDTGLAMGIRAAHDVLETAFEDIPRGSLLNARDLENAEQIVVGSLKADGLGVWLNAVKSHHSTSYRHSLFVTGSAISFAQFMGMGRRDQEKIARAALVHDVGKAFISLATLDKPGALTAEEFADIKRHPKLGYDLLRQSPGFSKDTLDAVLHHHEYLDGSGYPDGLSGSEISDLVRIITIADIFSALVEERAYKPAFTHERALEIMDEMGAKLDRDLLRVFAKMVRSQPAAS